MSGIGNGLTDDEMRALEQVCTPNIKDDHKHAVAEITKLIRLVRGYVWTLHQSGKVFGSAGIPDMFAVAKGRPFWIEVKVGKDRLRPAQAAFKAVVEAAGMTVVVGRAKDVADFLGL